MRDTGIRLLNRDHLISLVTAYPADINTRTDDLLATLDGFEMPVAHTLLIDETWRKVGDDISPDFTQCVLAGLSHVVLGFEVGPKRVGSRERPVKELLGGQSFQNQIARIRAEAELDEAGRHFFVFGVALGISIRHERSLRDLLRSKSQ